MKQSPFITDRRDRGRPRSVELTDDQGARLAEIYLSTNRTRTAGSMEAAWVLYCEDTGQHLHTIKHHRLVGALPVAAREWLQRARGLVAAKRGGAAKLRLTGPYQQGGMRTHWSEHRRLRAGESYSVDDLTRNVAVWIPWPHGGCPCSDKYGVRLGRWQTLVVHDDATGVIPAVSSVYRYKESYQAVDAASLIYQTETEVGMAGFGAQDSRWVVEGGVWQSQRVLDVLQGRGYSAKGRPNQKLIERWFGTVQTLDAAWNRDLGRQRGEILASNKLWIRCRAGHADPRSHFASWADGQQTLLHAIRYLNEREVRSDVYGRWVPQERWDHDVAEFGLVQRDTAESWLMSPDRRKLKVTRAGMVRCSIIMPDGVTRPLVWTSPHFADLIGKSVELYFDPLSDWPLDAVCVEPGTRVVLGNATCQNPFGASRDADRDRVAAIRRTMMSDLTIIMGGGAGTRRTTARGLGGTIEIVRPNNLDRLGCTGPAVPDPRQSTVAVETPLTSDLTGLRSLERKAAQARETTPNW